jgi:hypothetical protein
LAAWPSVAFAQTTWYVDDNAPSDPAPGDPTISDPLEDGSADHPFDAIQEGIDAATDGDEVVILDGTYTGDGNRDLDFAGRAITVRSQSGDPATCIIDCQGTDDDPHRGFYFHSGETAASVVERLTVRGGYVTPDGTGGYRGGGVYCSDSSPTLTHCVISGNTADLGGGMYLLRSSVEINDCTISENGLPEFGYYGDGGGIYCIEDSDPVIVNCTITRNRAPGFQYERAGYGGGVHVENNCHASLINCTVSANTAGARGSAISVLEADLTLLDCQIIENESRVTSSGGAVYLRTCAGVLRNCVIRRNRADVAPGVFCSTGTHATISNCVITDNVGGNWYGAALYCFESEAMISNCIIWGNGQPAMTTIDGIITANYSIVQQGWAGEGNFDLDPLLTANGHLTQDSPARDAGDPNGSYGDLRDIDGEARLMGVAVDIGADEYSDIDIDQLPDFWEERYFGDPLVAAPEGDLDEDGRLNLTEYFTSTDPSLALVKRYVDPEGDDNWDGLSPEWNGVSGPKATVQAAIDLANPIEGDEVILAAGTYSGPGNMEIDFVGRAITVRSASNDPATCTIDCHSESLRSRGFYFHSHETHRSIVQGLTITNSPDPYAGAISCVASSPTLSNCVITGNGSSDHQNREGGGLFCYDCESLIVDCVISDNLASEGGGVYSIGWSNPRLLDCTIASNTSINSGGGVHCWGGAAELMHCSISENVSHGSGGGLYCDAPGIIAVNCSITGNRSAQVGGGMHFDRSSPTIYNCIINGNASGTLGGGIFSTDGDVLLVGGTMTGNIAPLGGAFGLEFEGETNDLRVYNSIIRDNSSLIRKDLESTIDIRYCNLDVRSSAEGNIDVDPRFVRPGYWDDNGTPEIPDDDFWVDGDYRLLPGSPCIDAGSNLAVPEDVADLDGDGDVEERTPLDLAGRPRFFDDPATVDTGLADPPDYPEVVDMGAYEYPTPPWPGDVDFDGDIDLSDYAVIGDCFSGAAVPPPSGCAPADLDSDGDVDIHDFAAFELIFGYTEG